MHVDYHGERGSSNSVGNCSRSVVHGEIDHFGGCGACLDHCLLFKYDYCTGLFFNLIIYSIYS